MLSAVILAFVIVAQLQGKGPSIRRIAGLNAIDEAIGRATEMGRTVLMVPGIDGLTIPTLQAMSIFGYITRKIASFGNQCVMTTADSSVTGVAREVIREAYVDAGRPELFNSEDVRFLSDSQFSFASGVAGLISREKPAASFLFGAFYAESLIITEVGQRSGAIQVAGTSQTTQLPFFIVTCDYVILGDEFYAASAYISRSPTLLGSIVGQDYCKLLFLVAIIAGALAATALQYLGPHPPEILKIVANWLRP